MYVPEEYGTLFPYMIVDDAEKFVQFLSKAFDSKEIGRTVLPNGRIANIRILIGTSAFMVSQSEDGGMKAMAGAYYIYVEDVDATFQQVIALGAEQMFEPVDMPYLDRQAGVTDPFGNIWWISRRLVDEPYDS
jgi:PhnB protein